MITGTVVDTSALWHLTVYAVVAALVLVTAMGMIAVARTRLEGEPGAARRAPWIAVLATGLLFCGAVLVVGLWAMTQK